MRHRSSCVSFRFAIGSLSVSATGELDRFRRCRYFRAERCEFSGVYFSNRHLADGRKPQPAVNALVLTWSQPAEWQPARPEFD